MPNHAAQFFEKRMSQCYIFTMYYRLFCKPYPQYNHLFKSSKCLARTTELANCKWLEQKVVEWKNVFFVGF